MTAGLILKRIVRKHYFFFSPASSKSSRLACATLPTFFRIGAVDVLVALVAVASAMRAFFASTLAARAAASCALRWSGRPSYHSRRNPNTTKEKQRKWQSTCDICETIDGQHKQRAHNSPKHVEQWTFNLHGFFSSTAPTYLCRPLAFFL